MTIIRGVRGFFRMGLLSLFGAAVSMGCATSFTGSAHVPGGPAGCREVCGAYGMDLAGMVAMGEYSDGCICKVRGQTALDESTRIAVAGAAPAAVGVVMAMRAREQQQQHQY
jgi:hypothetical protein